jgi:predicted CXXCH cytochrome family protein
VAKLPGLGPDSPISRWVTRVSRGRLTPRGVRIATFGVGLAAALGLVALVFAVQVSSTPTFCGSCHIMKPYYESWQQSHHNGIACVECHISPGITAEVRKKWEALSMVAKYFTGTYSTNPWAEVDDAACLRCHERRLLEGREVFHEVLFDHTPHLTETRRGLKLRCTSCHSQIVQGSHIAVTSSTCALCHFKGQTLNQGLARCLACHEVPEHVTTSEGVTFDHSQVARLDMECTLCHKQVVRGVGNVPKERCLTCHNEPDRLEKFGETDYLHRQHVTDHKVDCMNCHLQIEHGKAPAPVAAHAMPPGGAAMAPEAGLGSDCESCHGSGHSPQQDLFAGVGGRGVPRMPSTMYLAGVTCQGCHNPALTTAAGRGATPAVAAATGADAGIEGPHSVRAGAVSCMSCHGPSYEPIYRAWKEGVDGRVGALRGQLEATVGAMGLSPPEPWLDAKHNFDLVSRGKGVHNVNFAFALLDQAHEQMNQARRAKGLGALSRPWRVIGGGASGQCLTCHAGIEKQSGSFLGRSFAHGPHVTSAQLDCAQCHRPHAERAPAEVVKFGAAGCVPCHHQQKVVDAPTCMNCHGDVTQKTLRSFRGEFSHAAHLEQGLECGTCHAAGSGDPRPAKAVCMQCHTEG